MPLQSTDDHVERALDKLLNQFNDSEKLQALLASWIKCLQEIDDWGTYMFDQLNCEVAEGSMLDRLGNIVGEPRRGFDDNIYRRNIKARIRINKSNGTPTELLGLLEFLFGSATGLSYIPGTPGNFYLPILTNLPSDISFERLTAWLCDATSAVDRGQFPIVDDINTALFWDVGNWDVNFWGGVIDLGSAYGGDSC